MNAYLSLNNQCQKILFDILVTVWYSLTTNSLTWHASFHAQVIHLRFNCGLTSVNLLASKMTVKFLLFTYYSSRNGSNFCENYVVYRATFTTELLAFSKSTLNKDKNAKNCFGYQMYLHVLTTNTLLVVTK